jgi:hypothetical protein
MDDTGSAALATVVIVLLFAWLVVVLVAGWKMYAKAGQPGWVALIPFLNVFGLLKIVHRPLWWFLMLLIPFVNIVFLVIIFNDLAKAFGHGVGMTVLLCLLTAIGYLVIGFGDSRYQLEPDPIFG